jgi:hypothetical protein
MLHPEPWPSCSIFLTTFPPLPAGDRRRVRGNLLGAVFKVGTVSFLTFFVEVTEGAKNVSLLGCEIGKVVHCRFYCDPQASFMDFLPCPIRAFGNTLTA